MSTWQKCPVCDGTGRVPDNYSSSMYSICTVCNGSKIISSLNGLPPKTTTSTTLNIAEEAVVSIVNMLPNNMFK